MHYLKWIFKYAVANYFRIFMFVGLFSAQLCPVKKHLGM